MHTGTSLFPQVHKVPRLQDVKYDLIVYSHAFWPKSLIIFHHDSKNHHFILFFSLRKVNYLTYLNHFLVKASLKDICKTHWDIALYSLQAWGCLVHQAVTFNISTEVWMARPLMGHIPVSNWPGNKKKFYFLWSLLLQCSQMSLQITIKRIRGKSNFSSYRVPLVKLHPKYITLFINRFFQASGRNLL